MTTGEQVVTTAAIYATVLGTILIAAAFGSTSDALAVFGFWLLAVCAVALYGTRP